MPLRRRLLALSLLLPLLSSCQQAVQSTVPEASGGTFHGLYELEMNSAQLQQSGAARIHSLAAGAPNPEISGLTYTPGNVMLVRDVATSTIHVTANFKVTNTSGTRLVRPTFMPAVVRGTNGTLLNTPFRNVRTTNGNDASSRANDIKVETSVYASGNGLTTTPDATPLIQDLDSSQIAASVGAGQVLYDIASQGWQGGPLEPGASQVVSFAMSVPMGAKASTTSQPDDVYSFSLLFAAVDNPPKELYSTMNTPEQQMVDYINEVRTKGSIGGDTSVRTGTCIAEFKPVAPLNAKGIDVAAVRAAKLHSNYQAFEGLLTHTQDNPNSLRFYGKEFTDRISRAEKEVGAAPGFRFISGENVGFTTPASGTKIDPAALVLQLLRSSDHCKNMVEPNFTHVGTGYSVMPEPRDPSRLRTTWTQVFVGHR